ncbi:IPT/TIG domain-containing protein [Pontiellaceae bacterium B1224]|nr:IPT/TIG domain-containing protein [Pontiellaceae bacterium B1224]
MKQIKCLFAMAVSLLGMNLAHGGITTHTIQFSDLSPGDGVENTLNVNGESANIEVVRDDLSHLGDISYNVTYESDLDGNGSLDTIEFTINVAAVSGSVADHGLTDVVSTDSATASIGTENASLRATSFLSINGNTPDGSTLIYTLNGLRSSVGNLQFDGFTGFEYLENSGHGHGYVVGIGDGLLGRAWNDIGDEVLRSATPILYVTGDQKNGTTRLPEAWGIGNVDFSFTITDRVDTADTFYVKTDGDDTSDGKSIDNAFATIQHAAHQMGPGDTCYILGGVYRETVDLSNLAGTANNPITFMNYQDQAVYIDGTDEITGKWNKERALWLEGDVAGTFYNGTSLTNMPGIGNVYRTTLPQDFGPIKQLFVGDKIMTLARFPNAPAYSDTVWTSEAQRLKFRDGQVEEGQISDRTHAVDNSVGTHTLANSGVSYVDCVAVTSFSGVQYVTEHEPGDAQFTYSSSGGYADARRTYFMEGGLGYAERVMLDSEGEWAYDENTGIVALWAPGGGDPDWIDEGIYAQTRTYGFIGNPYTQYITIDGVNLFAATFHFKSSDNITLQNCDLSYYASSERAFAGQEQSDTAEFIGRKVDFCKNITVYNCAFKYAPDTGFRANYVDSLLLENNLFYMTVYASVGGSDEYGEGRGANTVDCDNVKDLTYRRNTMATSGAAQGIRARRYIDPDPEAPVRPIVCEYNFHTDCGIMTTDGSSMYIPEEHAIESVARFNWFIENKQRCFRWDGANPVGNIKTLRGNLYRNVTTSNQKRGGASSFRLKGDEHEIYNNLGFNDNSAINVAEDKGGNPNSRVYNNAADSLTTYLDPSETNFFDSGTWWGQRGDGDFGLAGDDLDDENTSINFLGQLESRSLDDLLRDPSNYDFRPKADAYELIDQGVEVTNCTVNGELVDVTKDFYGAAPDLGAYEYNPDLKSYWIPGRQEAYATMPIPRDGGVGVPLSTDLMYLNGLKASQTKIYMGESADNLTLLAERGAGHTQENVIATDGYGLKPNTTYYWRVDTILTDGTVIDGDIWSFTTSPKDLLPLENRTIVGGEWEEQRHYVVYNNNSTAKNNRGILYSANAYQSTDGFKLTVVYQTGRIDTVYGHNFSFGLISTDTDLSTYTGFNPFSWATEDVYSLGANVAGDDAFRGLNFTDGTTCTNLDQSGDNAQFSVDAFTPVTIEIRPGGAWTYSINGVVEASGVIAGGFDLSKSYRVVAYGQDDHGGGKMIESMALDLLGEPVRLIAGVSPDSGPAAGGTVVTISGTNLGNGTDITNVTLRGVAAASIDSQSSTQVVATTASGTAGTGDVVVTSISRGTTTKRNAFSYVENQIIRIDGIEYVAGNGTFLMGFAATPGQTYLIQYTDSLTNGWTTVQPGIVAPSNRVQWVDSGLPGTESSPAEAATRFYRVINADQN